MRCAVPGFEDSPWARLAAPASQGLRNPNVRRGNAATDISVIRGDTDQKGQAKGKTNMETDKERDPDKPTVRRKFETPVRWLLGRQLLSAAKFIALFSLFSAKIDPRDWMQGNIIDLSGGLPSGEPGGPDEFWFDYLADSGDSQLSTYNVAYLCFNDLYGEPEKTKPLSFDKGKDDKAKLLPRGKFLIIGGDTAYHVADYITLS